MQERLLHLLRSLAISKKDFAEKIGLSPSTISDYINGRLKSISTDAVGAIYKEFAVNPAWLLTGEGDMFLPSKSTVSPFDQGSDRLSRIVSALPEKEQDAVKDFVEYRAARSGIDTSKIKEPPAVYGVDSLDDVHISLLGRIPAGVPMFAEENIERMLRIPKDWLPRSKNEFFALRVRGESMMGVGILDGDIVILEKIESVHEEIRNGDIVAALIDAEATLKRLFFMDGKAELRAENPEFETITITKKNFVLIQGKLVLLVREFKGEE